MRTAKPLHPLDLALCLPPSPHPLPLLLPPPQDLKLVKTLNSSSKWATCAAMLPLTQKLAVGSFSRAIRIFDLASFELCGMVSGSGAGVHARTHACVQQDEAAARAACTSGLKPCRLRRHPPAPRPDDGDNGSGCACAAAQRCTGMGVDVDVDVGVDVGVGVDVDVDVLH